MNLKLINGQNHVDNTENCNLYIFYENVHNFVYPNTIILQNDNFKHWSLGIQYFYIGLTLVLKYVL